MIEPGAIYRTSDSRLLLVIEVVRQKAGYNVWSLLALDGKLAGQVHKAECYWLENQERVA